MSGIFLNSISADNALIIAGGGGGATGSGTHQMPEVVEVEVKLVFPEVVLRMI